MSWVSLFRCFFPRFGPRQHAQSPYCMRLAAVEDIPVSCKIEEAHRHELVSLWKGVSKLNYTVVSLIWTKTVKTRCVRDLMVMMRTANTNNIMNTALRICACRNNEHAIKITNILLRKEDLETEVETGKIPLLWPLGPNCYILSHAIGYQRIGCEYSTEKQLQRRLKKVRRAK